MTSPRRARGSVPVVPVVLVILALAACGGSPTQTRPTCTYTVSAAPPAFAAAGGSGTIPVETAASCAWTARADSGWIAITSGASGTGSGTVAFTVAPNDSTAARSGGLTVADRAIAIAQNGAAVPCSYDLSSSSAAHTKDAGNSSFGVAAPAGCRWTAVSGAPWVVIAPGSAEGTGNGTVSYSVSRNVDVTARNAVITVATRSFAVSQSGDSGACDYGVTPTDIAPCMLELHVFATVTTQAGCTWTAAASDPWIAIASGASGSGPGTIVFVVAENYLAPRSGQVLVRWPTPTAGQNIRVTQAGCRYAVNPATTGVAAAGGTGSFDVLQQSDPYTCGGPLQNGCTWTAVSTVPWITITTSMPRSGDDRVSFTVAPNTGAARTGTMTVRDQAVRVTQAGT